jgi:putative peptidoglycan lipid II flippase
MSEPTDDWSEPALYQGRSRVFEPRTFTEADPISQVLLIDWDDEDEQDRPQWSPATIVGPSRLKRRMAAAAGTRTGQRDATAAAPPAPTDAHPEAHAEARAEAAAVEATEPPRTTDEPAGETVRPAEQENRGLLANSRTMAIASLASRVTGFLRSSLLVAALGVHEVADAYNVANTFPNMVYELLLGGVLSSVLVPLLVHAQEDDEDGGVAYTQRLLSVATAALGAMTLVAVACAPLLAGAFANGHDQRDLTTLFATLLLPEIFFYGLGAMFMAVLNVRHSFGPGAWSPVLNNVIMIVTIGVFWALPGPHDLRPDTITTSQVLVLGIGTTLGIAAQALVLIPALRATNFHWQWRFRARPNEVGRMREVGTLAGWVFGYVVASQVGVTVIAVIGVHHHGAYTVFTNADLLVQMPYGILVVSLLTALMPRLSRSAARGRIDAVKDDLSLGARLSAIALLPITAGFIVLGPLLGVVLFAYGETSISGARLIGIALAASAFGLFPFALVMLQLRVFYAMRDGRTPTLINIWMVVTKVAIVAIAAATLHDDAHIAYALTAGTSASYVIGAIVGYVALSKRLGLLGFRDVVRTVAQIGAASIVGAAVALVIVLAVTSGLGKGHAGSVVGLVGGGVAGLAALAFVAWRMRIPEIQDLARLARRR